MLQAACRALLAVAMFGMSACDSDQNAREDGAVRVAVFNTHLARAKAGKLIRELETGSAQLDAVVKVIAANDPDILIVQEIDYDPEAKALRLFQDHLRKAGSAYAYAYTAPVNTGIQTGFDLDGDGKSYGPGDAQGWGLFEGQFGMAVLSRYPIETDVVRTFQMFKWADMPDALIPEGFYPEEAISILRLSSKSHWDVPITIKDGLQLNLLVSHPTPPVFDGNEDRNGRRNHDEIAFWSAYLDGAEWIVDDSGRRGGIGHDATPVIAGDLNNDPFDGDGRSAAIRALLENPALQDPKPRSEREVARLLGLNKTQSGDPALDTADWRDEGKNASGDLRVDYLLPAQSLTVMRSGVFWPGPGDAMLGVVEQASDHRLVWIDLTF